MALAMEGFIHEEEEVDHPVRYLPLGRVYSSTAPYSKVISKKVKARMITAGQGDCDDGDEGDEEGGCKKRPFDCYDSGHEEPCMDNAAKPILVYRRRKKKARLEDPPQQSWDGDGDQDGKGMRKKNVMKYELLRLGNGLGPESGIGRSRLRGLEGAKKINFAEVKKRERGAAKDSSWAGNRWVGLEIEGANPQAFVGLACKIFWPMDDDWYKGSVTQYNSASKKHCVEYDDGDTEFLTLVDEKIKFHISYDEMRNLNLKFGVPNMEKKGYNELLALAVSFHDCQDLDPGDLVWAKLTGHAMWPAVVVDESVIGTRRGLKSVRVDQSVLVQFFGTHDFARIRLKQAVPFLNGLLSSLHLKCKQARFYRSLDEAKLYLSTQQLPKSMLLLQKAVISDECNVESREYGVDSCDDLSEELMQKSADCSKISPIEIGSLRVTNLGRIIYDSDNFHNKKHIWPEGYTAFRNFTSIKDPSLLISYKMEVLRNPKLKVRPLFRVTPEDGEQVDGSTPSACWKEIYNRIRKNQCNGVHAEVDPQRSGSYMFGFSNPQICQLIQELPNSRMCSKYFENCGNLPAGYRAVRIEWKDLDRCSVCDMDEEYEDNLFLQCDKCCMMVHARCYGELEPLDGVLWLCNLCRPGAPSIPPRCCLCPVTGGAMKPTADGRWAHLTCAMWIPETCLIDVKRMEPIDGISRINKDRWKLLCSICGVSYGACIQCSHNTCRVAYHPLCARAAGLCVELEDEDKIHLMSLDEDDDQCIRLLSFCKKHRPPSNGRPSAEENLKISTHIGSTSIISVNPSGCARTEPYNFARRRGQKQPQDLVAASVKRLFVENRPYLVSGYRQNGTGCSSSCNEYSQIIGALDSTQQESTGNIVNISSMSEKYKNMKTTVRKRLAFGKSRIHGFGVFAKLTHKAGDMVIEYIGELVRPTIADLRERRIYNSLVGAGTYMFRIDDERVVDATRAGSIAHLINHSCEPNCYSRVISVNGDDHIIIFAKRDINKWEELTYDYRFFSIDEQLSCYCGFPRCRGIVNDSEAEQQSAKVSVHRSDLIHWKGE